MIAFFIVFFFSFFPTFSFARWFCCMLLEKLDTIFCRLLFIANFFSAQISVLVVSSRMFLVLVLRIFLLIKCNRWKEEEQHRRTLNVVQRGSAKNTAVWINKQLKLFIYFKGTTLAAHQTFITNWISCDFASICNPALEMCTRSNLKPHSRIGNNFYLVFETEIYGLS